MTKESKKIGNFHIVGGGCFGSQYARWLLRARQRGMVDFKGIIAVDHHTDCKLLSEGPKHASLRVEIADWVDYATQLLLHKQEGFEADHWVPSPLSPHLLFLAMLRAAESLHPEKRFVAIPFQEKVPLPVSFALPVGTMAVSYAEWTCPVNCIEPATCPAIEAPRTWDMKPALTAHFADREVSAHILQCQHLVHGVGTIPWREIGTAFQKLLSDLEKGQETLAIATVSRCHGIIGAASVQSSQPQAKRHDADQQQAAH